MQGDCKSLLPNSKIVWLSMQLQEFCDSFVK